MSRLPLLIGISGKRKFDDGKTPEQDRAVAETVRARFDQIFRKLDNDFPDTPKILLTGAALGTDMIAAQVARTRAETSRQWAVVALLPFEREEFRKDFDQGPTDPSGPQWAEHFQQHKDEFDALMAAADDDERQRANSPRVIVRELPKLLVSPVVRGQRPADASHTRRPPRASRIRFGTEHYEQVGQFIAEAATIMIAVARAGEPADMSQATGGTNRVVAYRRAGHADDAGAEVARKSRILRKDPREPIAPPARFVWLLDPYDTSSTFGTDDYPIRVLAPFADHSIAYDYEHATFADTDTGHEQSPRAQQTFDSLVLARAFSRFNAKQKQPPIADVSAIAKHDLTRILKSTTGYINQTQMDTNWWSRRAFWCIAVLFVVAIFTFETYAKFFNTSWVALGLYLVTLLLMGGVLWFARKENWQANAEDYRAVAETLRVQEAWWCAALHDRVDREHLQGASKDLLPVRDAATAIIAWHLVRCGWRDMPEPDWTMVRGSERTPRRIEISHQMPKPFFVTLPVALARKLRGEKPEQYPPDWVGDQLTYFARKAAAREDAVHITDAASWTLFIASGFIGCVIWLLLAFANKARHTYPVYDFLRSISTTIDGYGGNLSPLVWAFLALLPVYWRVRNRRTKGRKGLKLHFAAGALTAFLISLALVNIAPAIAPAIAHSVTNESPEPVAAKYAMIVSLVVLSAFAGAWRYLTERLNIEAEAHEYHDAHRRFDRAEHLLAAEFAKAEPDEDRARTIVFELGRLALAENEAWLKSRRERPLTPVVG